jgi:hypothetical protein
MTTNDRFICFVGMGMYESFRYSVLRILEGDDAQRHSDPPTPQRLGKRKRKTSFSVPLPSPPVSPGLTPGGSQPRTTTASQTKRVPRVECGMQDLKLVLPGTWGSPEPSYTYCYLVPSTSGLVTQYQVGPGLFFPSSCALHGEADSSWGGQAQGQDTFLFQSQDALGSTR